MTSFRLSAIAEATTAPRLRVPLRAASSVVARLSLAFRAGLVALTMPRYARLGRSIVSDMLVPKVVILALLIGILLHHQMVPDLGPDVMGNELMIVIFLMMLRR